MEAREQTRQIRLSKWAEIIQARQDSGQTVRSFCEDNNINVKRYYYWQRKLRDEACRELGMVEDSTPSGWMICSQQSAAIKQATPITIEIGGCRVEVEDSINMGFLKDVCEVLKSLC